MFPAVEKRQSAVAIGERDRAAAARAPAEHQSGNRPFILELADRLAEEKECDDRQLLSFARHGIVLGGGSAAREAIEPHGAGSSGSGPDLFGGAFLLDVDLDRIEARRSAIRLERPVLPRPVRLLVNRRQRPGEDRPEAVMQLLRRRIAVRGLDVDLESVRRPSELPQLAFQLAEIEFDDRDCWSDGDSGDVDWGGRRLASER